MEELFKKYFTRIAEGHVCSAEVEDMAFSILASSLNEKRDYINMHKAVKQFQRSFLNGLAEYKLQFLDKLNLEEDVQPSLNPNGNEPDPNKLFTPVEVADILGVSRMTVNNYINEGKLRASRLSEKKTRISEVDLNDFITSSKRKFKVQAA